VERRAPAGWPLHRKRCRNRPPRLIPLVLLQPLLLSSLANGLAALPAVAAPDCQDALASAQRQPIDLQAKAPRLAVLLLGEIHTSADDHDWQLQMLESLWRGGRRRLSLGLEMIPAARQPVLDRFNAGQLSEEELLRQVDWAAVWGHDPDLYAPLLRWARLRGVPLLALNAEPRLVQRVRQEGLAAIPAAEREGIGSPAAASPAYRQRVEAHWRGHRALGVPATADPAAAVDRQRFIESQLLRDRAMAERLAAAHRRDPQRLQVALIGEGHLEGGDGVPRQLQELGLRQLLSLSRPALPTGCTVPPRGARLGAYLESNEQGVWVRQVAPASPAEAAGLRPGDRILELNGMAVQRAGQVIRGVRLQPDGLPLQLTIERNGRRQRLELRLPPSADPRLAARENGPRSGPWSRTATRRLTLSPP
jgi:uncharacterized iron-regulated protein